MTWLDFSAQGGDRERQIRRRHARVTNAGRRFFFTLFAVNRAMIPPLNALGNQQVLNRYPVPANGGTVLLPAAVETESALRVGEAGRSRAHAAA